MGIQSVKFTQAQLDEISRLRNIATTQPVDAIGAYAPMYEYIAQIAEDAENASQQSDPEIHKTWLWLKGGIGINSDEGAFSKIIREYNIRQGLLRFGAQFSDSQLQEASNEVGERMYQQIFTSVVNGGTGGYLPTLKEIGEADLNGVRDVLYGGASGPLPLNQAWPGIIMLGKLGEDLTGRLLQNNDTDPKIFNTLEDAMNVLYAWESFRYAFESTSLFTDFDWRDVRIAWNINEAADILNAASPRAWFDTLIQGQNANALLPLKLASSVGSNNFLDMLLGAQQGKSVFGATTDANFKNNAQEYFGNLSTSELQAISIELMPTSASEMVSKAMTDVNARSALAALSSVSVMVSNSVSNNLDLYDANSVTGELTSQYLADRATMLEWKIIFDSGSKDYDDVLSTYLIGTIGSAIGGVSGAALLGVAVASLYRNKAYGEEWDSTTITGDWDFIDLSATINSKPLKLAIDGVDYSTTTNH